MVLISRCLWQANLYHIIASITLWVMNRTGQMEACLLDEHSLDSSFIQWLSSNVQLVIKIRVRMIATTAVELLWAVYALRYACIHGYSLYDTIPYWLAYGCGMLLTKTLHALFCAEPNMEAKYLQKLLVGVLILAANAKANTGKNFDMEHIFHFSALWLESVTHSWLTNLFLIHHWLKNIRQNPSTILICLF